MSLCNIDVLNYVISKYSELNNGQIEKDLIKEQVIFKV